MPGRHARRQPRRGDRGHRGRGRGPRHLACQVLRRVVGVGAGRGELLGLTLAVTLGLAGVTAIDRKTTALAAPWPVENGAVTIAASRHSCAVQVAAAVDDQAGDWIFTVGAAKQHMVVTTTGAHLVNRAVLRGASKPGRAIQIPAAVRDQTPCGSSPFAPLKEATGVMVPLPLATSKTVPSPVTA